MLRFGWSKPAAALAAIRIPVAVARVSAAHPGLLADGLKYVQIIDTRVRCAYPGYVAAVAFCSNQGFRSTLPLRPGNKLAVTASATSPSP